MKILTTVLALVSSAVVAISCVTVQNDGTPAVYPDASDSRYVLPYDSEISRKVIQGNSEKNEFPWTHFGKFRFAYDFAMPIGTRVLASRKGMVMYIRDEYTDEDHQNAHGNVIIVLHEDGTAAMYGHLKQKGSLVRMNTIVEAGTAIALSGNSGESPEPHLHFQVNENGDFSKSSTIPISFSNSGARGELKKGESYPRRNAH